MCSSPTHPPNSRRRAGPRQLAALSARAVSRRGREVTTAERGRLRFGSSYRVQPAPTPMPCLPSTDTREAGRRNVRSIRFVGVAPLGTRPWSATKPRSPRRITLGGVVRTVVGPKRCRFASMTFATPPFPVSRG